MGLALDLGTRSDGWFETPMWLESEGLRATTFDDFEDNDGSDWDPAVTTVDTTVYEGSYAAYINGDQTEAHFKTFENGMPAGVSCWMNPETEQTTHIFRLWDVGGDLPIQGIRTDADRFRYYDGSVFHTIYDNYDIGSWYKLAFENITTSSMDLAVYDANEAEVGRATDVAPRNAFGTPAVELRDQSEGNNNGWYADLIETSATAPAGTGTSGWGEQSGDGYYYAEVDADAGTLGLYKQTAEGPALLNETTGLSIPTDEHFTVRREWAADGTMTVYLLDGEGAAFGTVEGAD